MFLLLLLLTICANCERISILVSTGTSEIPGINQQLSNAYLRYLYSAKSRDVLEIIVGGQKVLPWTLVSEKHRILNVIKSTNLQNNLKCLPSLFLNSVTNSNAVYLIMDQEPCTSQLKSAYDLKSKGISIFAIGIGKHISEKTVEMLSGPCNGMCIPGWNFIHVGR